jgi:hypothetical protein
MPEYWSEACRDPETQVIGMRGTQHIDSAHSGPVACQREGATERKRDIVGGKLTQKQV